MQKNSLKTFAAVLLAAIMLFSVLPVGAIMSHAENNQDIVSFALTQEGKNRK